jgi:hypothetical protein
MLTSRCDRPGDNGVGRVVAAHGVDGDQRAGVRGRRVVSVVQVGPVQVGRGLVISVLVRVVLAGPGWLGSGMPVPGCLPRLSCVWLTERLPVTSWQSMVGIWLFRAPHAAKLLIALTRARPARGR